MDEIINILLLVIIFVFDPLAISLVITANFAFKQAYKKEEKPVEEEEEVIDIPEKDWVEDWPSNNDEELETASLQDLEKWEDEEQEPYQIYVSGSKEPEGATLNDEEQSKHTDWEIIDEEKEHTRQELDSQIQELNQQVSKLQANPNISTWKKAKDLTELGKQQQALQSRKKNLDDDDLVIKYT